LGVEGVPFLLYGVIMVLSLAGFHGVFFYRSLLKKAAAWGVFQSGIILLLMSLTGRPPLDPLPHAMALLALAVLIGMVLALFAFCLVLWNKYETMDAKEISKEVGK
jgi:multisubunit Na+/H+ antiporter MnhC subunit